MYEYVYVYSCTDMYGHVRTSIFHLYFILVCIFLKLSIDFNPYIHVRIFHARIYTNMYGYIYIRIFVYRTHLNKYAWLVI